MLLYRGKEVVDLDYGKLGDCLAGRLYAIRKELKLSQEEFGSKIGITRSAICNYENGTRPISEQVILAVGREFSVRPEWLRDGSGEVFVPKPEGDSFDTLLKSRDIPTDDLETIKSVIGAFLELKKPSRDAVVEFVRKCAEKMNAPTAAVPASEVDILAELKSLKEQNQELRTRLEAIEKEDAEAERERLAKAKKKAF